MTSIHLFLNIPTSQTCCYPLNPKQHVFVFVLCVCIFFFLVMILEELSRLHNILHLCSSGFHFTEMSSPSCVTVPLVLQWLKTFSVCAVCFPAIILDTKRPKKRQLGKKSTAKFSPMVSAHSFKVISCAGKNHLMQFFLMQSNLRFAGNQNFPVTRLPCLIRKSNTNLHVKTE